MGAFTLITFTDAFILALIVSLLAPIFDMVMDIIGAIQEELLYKTKDNHGNGNKKEGTNTDNV